MKIEKIINNNVVVSVNAVKTEMIFMGKGLGFQKKISDEIDESKIEKAYASTKEWNVDKLMQLLASIPLEQCKWPMKSSVLLKYL